MEVVDEFILNNNLKVFLIQMMQLLTSIGLRKSPQVLKEWSRDLAFKVLSSFHCHRSNTLSSVICICARTQLAKMNGNKRAWLFTWSQSLLTWNKSQGGHLSSSLLPIVEMCSLCKSHLTKRSPVSRDSTSLSKFLYQNFKKEKNHFWYDKWSKIFKSA